uniref:HypC/HybG/HupF family hydrogenase formation chaperone n=1 Tax=Eubacterium cellulosolvens TaxID=29322 RepID=UPI0004813E70|nr:HypC/HybG/HupF family hydrogenase formation chaperone [[Eubacterium] cellulosolvens]
MCVALPGEVIEVNGTDALVDFSGNRVMAKAGLTEVKPGDRVLVHAGCIIQRVTVQEAEEMEALMRDLAAFDAE